LPFDGDSLTAIAAAISVDTPASLLSHRPEVPAELDAVVMACLAKDREARVSSLASLARMLTPFGGKSAAVLAGRIQGALGMSQPPPPESQAASSQAAVAVSARRPEVHATRPEWTKTGASGERTNVKMIALAAGFGVLLVVAAVVLLRHSGGSDVTSVAAGATSGGEIAAPVRTPTTQAPAPASAAVAPKPDPVEEPVVSPAASARAAGAAAARPKPAPVAPTRPPAKSAPSGGKVKKPLVTTL
jgi:hypothetical protein